MSGRNPWARHRGLILAAAAMVVLGLGLGLAGGHFLARRAEAPGAEPRPPQPSGLAPQGATDQAGHMPATDVHGAAGVAPPPDEAGPGVVVEEEPAMPVAPAPPAAEAAQGSKTAQGTDAGTGAASPSAHTPAPALPPPHAGVPAASGPKGLPAWRRFALAAPEAGGRPMIAVIIDDMGVDKRRSERILQLPGPLTISFMSYAEELPRQVGEARAHGHELMMHIPMEPLGEHIDPGPNALLTSLPLDEIRRRFVDDLARFDGFVGVNNHMGSKFTAYAPGMQVVMEELHRRGLLFIDSLTTDKSVGLALAQKDGIPSAARNVFLDNAGDIISVDSQLAKVEEVARHRGSAIAIGHPRDATIAALAAWLPGLTGKGFVLVPVSAVVRARMGDAG